eukprot:CAMPEP_0195287150 /NCGR_PEP_ID=MMETSP0707-20130614/4334_1 /TAXON_ID=33640 /ORGANISM="Asterionellopsis glacialis, Strain CCMP134" /LENGTH=414 /DNA_ID=CAMNT_0040346879 /DNA_START=138 /DNA_END=1379 /DNA_ORIENTATION=-
MTTTTTTTKTKTNISDSVRQVARNTLRLRRSLHSISQRGEDTHRRLIEDSSYGDTDSLLVPHVCPSISSNDAVNGDSVRKPSNSSRQTLSRNLMAACLVSGIGGGTTTTSTSPLSQSSSSPPPPSNNTNTFESISPRNATTTPNSNTIMTTANEHAEQDDHQFQQHSSNGTTSPTPQQQQQQQQNHHNHNDNAATTTERVIKKKSPKDDRKTKKTKKCAQLKIPISSQLQEDLLEVEFIRFPVNFEEHKESPPRGGEPLLLSPSSALPSPSPSSKEKTTMVAQLKIDAIVTMEHTPNQQQHLQETLHPTSRRMMPDVATTTNSNPMIHNNHNSHNTNNMNMEQQLKSLNGTTMTDILVGHTPPHDHDPPPPTTPDLMKSTTTSSFFHHHQDRLDVEYVPMVLVRLTGQPPSSKW